MFHPAVKQANSIESAIVVARDYPWYKEDCWSRLQPSLQHALLASIDQCINATLARDMVVRPSISEQSAIEHSSKVISIRHIIKWISAHKEVTRT